MADCETCGEPLVDVVMRIDGSLFEMRSCPACDTHGWHRDGEDVEFSDVLEDLTATTTRYRRSLTG